MAKVNIASIWLDGCSGCHMSFLDMDEVLLDLADRIALVYSPLVDNKVFPEMVDVTIVEGAVSSEGDLEKIIHVREHTRILVSLGDCAVTGNIPAMRNSFKLEQVLSRAYIENADLNQHVPQTVIPALLPKVRPVHHVVNVDVYVPGCPPAASKILYVLSELLEGRIPQLGEEARFG
jgi:NAD-reducing hydrogenase small subunit